MLSVYSLAELSVIPAIATFRNATHSARVTLKSPRMATQRGIVWMMIR